MAKKHPIPPVIDRDNPTIKCWHCKNEFKTNKENGMQIVETENEVVAYAKCPHCGTTCTLKLETKPMSKNFKFK